MIVFSKYDEMMELLEKSDNDYLNDNIIIIIVCLCHGMDTYMFRLFL